MNSYEFWNDIDKIFNAIVSYQEKTIEFNKQFINPWIKLGNIFDKKETIEAIVAHKNAIEIDPDNAQNWYELANAYTRAGDFERSLQAYQKANKLGLESGDLYRNMALAHVMTGQYQEAIPIFEQSLNRLENIEEKAIVWNHLGNVYRKLNNYEMALQAFQKADRVENKQSASDKEPPAVRLEEELSELQNLGAIHLEDKSSATLLTQESATAEESDPQLDEIGLNGVDEKTVDDMVLAIDQTKDLQAGKPGSTPAMPSSEGAELSGLDEQGEQSEESEIDDDLPVLLDIDFSKSIPFEMHVDEIRENFEDEHAKDVSTSTLPSAAPTFSAQRSVPLNTLSFKDENMGNGQEADEEEPFAKIMKESFYRAEEELEGIEGEGEVFIKLEEQREDDFDSFLDFNKESLEQVGYEHDVRIENVKVGDGEKKPESFRKKEAETIHLAYDEYLKDSSSEINMNLLKTDLTEAEATVTASADTEATYSESSLDESADETFDMDTKNAFVWNELGNVYFNAGLFDDAIAAYIKAIDLDRKYAWPYTNLALSFVQKGRLEDAIPLYQRSIELFSTEKDKAITWNRLGNVYRRLNDYENAIASYQRADELSPGNAAITQQAKFSLLGNEKVKQEVESTL